MIYFLMMKRIYIYMTFDYLYDTQAYLPIEDNQGNATIEIFKDNKQIWSNEK